MTGTQSFQLRQPPHKMNWLPFPITEFNVDLAAPGTNMFGPTVSRKLWYYEDFSYGSQCPQVEH